MEPMAADAVPTLPPAVPGHPRCYLLVHVDRYVPHDGTALDVAQVSFAWWGDPARVHAAVVPADGSSRTLTWRFAVVSGPRQLRRYLEDASVLRVDVGTVGKPGALLGSAQIRHVAELVEQRELCVCAGVYNGAHRRIGQLYVRLELLALNTATASPRRHHTIK